MNPKSITIPLLIGLSVVATACRQEPPPCPGAEALYWHDPMYPDEHFDGPGSSPYMDMPLVPVCSAAPSRDTTGSTDIVRVEPGTLQNLGVRTVPVITGALEREVRTTGTFTFDESTQRTVTLRIVGWIDELYVNQEGQRVERGEPLARIYAPDLVSTQQEYLLALRNRAAVGETEEANRLVSASRRRLELFEVSPDQIRALEESGRISESITVFSPARGTIVRKPAVEGMHVQAGQTLFEIVDYSRLWLSIDVPEADLFWVRPGTSASIRVTGREDAPPIAGRVDFVYDEVDPALRTGRARVVVPNAAGVLKDGMYATVILRGAPTEPSTLVPTDAVIRESDDAAVVVVALGEGRFQPRRVRVGAEADGLTQIFGDVMEGERVVASAQFLIDSEARLSGALAGLGGSTDSLDMPAMH